MEADRKGGVKSDFKFLCGVDRLPASQRHKRKSRFEERKELGLEMLNLKCQWPIQMTIYRRSLELQIQKSKFWVVDL